MKGLAFVFVILCLINSSIAIAINFNSSWVSECEAGIIIIIKIIFVAIIINNKLLGCDFNTADMWIPPQVPSINDTVTIQYVSSNTTAFIFIDSQITVR